MMRKNELVGYVILITSTAGYGGDIQMAIGINTEYQITGISFLTLNETAGLGMERIQTNLSHSLLVSR